MTTNISKLLDEMRVRITTQPQTTEVHAKINYQREEREIEFVITTDDKLQRNQLTSIIAILYPGCSNVRIKTIKYY